MKRAVILLSGGLDSSTVLGYALKEGYECYPISFSYGQKNSFELNAAKKIVEHFNIKNHKVVHLPNDMFGNSAMTREDIAIPDYKDSDEAIIPVTYVPARNTIFLSIALGYAESIGAFDIFLGISNIDYSGYPDCRPEYLAAFEKLANLATKEGVEGNKITMHAPLLYMSKAETILTGVTCGVDYGLTVSCYKADAQTGAACKTCDSCTYRRKGFIDAGVPDPTKYLDVTSA